MCVFVRAQFSSGRLVNAFWEVKQYRARLVLGWVTAENTADVNFFVHRVLFFLLLVGVGIRVG